MSSLSSHLQARQDEKDPLKFTLLAIGDEFSQGVRDSVEWLEERGMSWRRDKDISFIYTVTLPDEKSAAYFKLAFVGR